MLLDFQGSLEVFFLCSAHKSYVVLITFTYIFLTDSNFSDELYLFSFICSSAIFLLDGYPASLTFPIMHKVHAICTMAIT